MSILTKMEQKQRMAQTTNQAYATLTASKAVDSPQTLTLKPPLRHGGLFHKLPLVGVSPMGLCRLIYSITLLYRSVSLGRREA